MVSSDSEPPLAAAQRETLQAVNTRLQQQLTLIDEVLSLTRLRTGKLRVHKRPIAAGVLLAAVMGFRFQAEQKGVRLVNEVPDSLQLAADPVLFGQVVQNLVSNAIKFSRPGGTVRLFAPPDHAASLAVQDNGVGIDPKRLLDLFRSDVKTSTVGTAGERGTGMGLPLSHDIVAAHGGTLRVESEPGRGSTFYVDMPPYRPVVMVVDDETDLRTLFTRYLARMGCEVIESPNGEEALKLLQTTYPSLIITDIQMPKLDGFGLLDAVRRNPETAEIPVIVVTVGTDVEIRDKAFGLGANDFVTKPITPHDFVPRVRRFLT
jgi:CheY-like chemotaxis protein